MIYRTGTTQFQPKLQARLGSQVFLALALLGAAIFWSGCQTSTVESRKKERGPAFSILPTDQQLLVDQGKIKGGMTPDAVYIAWGPPSDVLENETPQGHSTVWLYLGQWVQEYRYWIGRYPESDYYPRNYLRAEIVFQNGAVVSWRTLPKPVQ